MALIALPLTFVLFSREKTSKVSTTNLREGQLNLVGEEFNDMIITEVRMGGLICLNAFAQNDSHFNFYGSIRNYIFADTHTKNVAGIADMFYYLPDVGTYDFTSTLLWP